MLTILFASMVAGYSYKIHRFLGNMLGAHLETNYPVIYNKVLEDLDGSPIGEASVWADKVKRTKKYYWTKKLHYTNIDACSITEDGIEDVCPDGCIYTFINDLVDRKYTDLSPGESIKFLLHSLQDINQPLHVYNRDRGGNSFKLIRNKNGRNRTMSLHSLWDNEIPSYYIKNFYSKKKHMNILTYNTTLVDVINFNLILDCTYVYNITDNFIIFEKYFNPLIVRALFDNYISVTVSILKKYYT